MTRSWIRYSFVLVSLFSTLFATSFAHSQQNRAPFGRRPAQAQKEDFRLTKEAGPWLIFCANFATQDGTGVDEANNLVRELRSLGLKAYTYEKKFDFKEYSKLGLGVQNKSVDDDTNVAKKMKLNGLSTYTDLSVLVGDFRSKDDPNALHRLGQLKRYRPRALKAQDSRRRMYAVRHFFDEVSKRTANLAGQKDPKAGLGPMRAAFLTPNPLLPESAYKAVADKSLLIKLNSESKFSLLKCKGKYSVRVATFRGRSYVNDKEIKKEKTLFQRLMTGRSKKSNEIEPLDLAAMNAEHLALQLSSGTSDVYTYHDRGSSFVSVGSFDWAVKEINGRKVVNPKVQRVIDYFKAQEIKSNIPGVPNYYKTKKFKSFEKGKLADFDIVPVAVEVPTFHRR